MKHLIARVEPGSLAREAGIRAGDRLVSIGGKDVIDWLDYQAFTCERNVKLVVERDGQRAEYGFVKDEYEPLGLSFDTEMMSRTWECVNHCQFCFVDQLPGYVRDSLRVKDDDWRLSLMMGNFVTLTNVSDSELRRIIDRHASPLYISVHATDPELRERLVGCKRAGLLMDQLRALQRGGIRFHAQAVICPGINDGDQLERTIRELAQMYPACMDVGIVPVGLTKFKNPDLRPFTGEEARKAMEICERWREKMTRETGEPFVYPTDEFYLIAGMDFPPEESYGSFDQIENGVGLYRLLESEMAWAYEEADLRRARAGTALIATGVSAAPLMKRLTEKFPIPGVKVEILPVVNRFFGDTVTVAGLLTGGDLKDALMGRTADRILITECMLREGEDVFLDGMTLNELQNSVSAPIVKVGRRGEDLLNALCGAEIVGG